MGFYGIKGYGKNNKGEKNEKQIKHCRSNGFSNS